MKIILENENKTFKRRLKEFKFPREESWKHMKSWNMVGNSSFHLTRWCKKECPKFFQRDLLGIWTLLSIPRWLRPYCMHSPLPWAFLTLHLSGSLSTIWNILILTPFLGGGLSLALSTSFHLFTLPLVKSHGFCFCLIHLISILYTQPPVRSLQNKTCHVIFLLKIL